METRIPLSVPKSQLNCSQTSSTITSVTTTEMSKPKKRIFSSGTKQNRAVFNMKNFWSVDNNSKKIVSSKKSSIFDVQYVWRPKTVTTTASETLKRDSSPTAPITNITNESSLKYLPPITTQSSVISSTKSLTTSPTNNINSTNNLSKNSVKHLINTVSTHSMTTRSTTPSLITSTLTDDITDDDMTDPTINECVESRPTSPSDSASIISECCSSPPSEESLQSLPTTSGPTTAEITAETLVTTSDVITSESSSASTTSSVTTTTITTTTQITSKPKRKIFSSANKKNRAVFNAKNFWKSETSAFDDEFSSQTNEQTINANKTDNKNKLSDEFDAEDNDYVVLRRVKKAHQCHDLGETEQFDDDIKYHLSGIDGSNSAAMRCLSILGLSQQAMRPEFRMHLRAHDDMPRIISALMDAPSDPNLALCAATLMFVYSQDRLTMDIDPNALSLMLQLLETRSDECIGVEIKHRNKVNDLCEEMKKKGHAKYLKMSEITAGNLAMETLLGLTSKRAGDWFKEELRRIKGIDFILDTVLRCSQFEGDEGFMVKTDRCMHVLENVTFNNIENQEYILQYKEGIFTSTCIKLLHSCKYHIISSNDSKVFLSAFFSILRVLTHLTSESADGCLVIGSYDGIIDLLLDSVLELPSFIMSDQRFDLMIILLCLCINLVEFCPKMRDLVVSSNSKLNDLIQLLFKRIEEAHRTEQQTDELLESHEKVQMTEAMRDSLLHTMLSQSGNHMEHSIIAACIALLLGCTIQDNFRYTNTVRNNLPNNSFEPLVEVLQKLRDFAFLADIMTKKGKERVDRIIQVFKSS